jgi:hypothetical protein
MKTSQQFQKISAGISLVILATGFSLMGLMSIIHRPLSSHPLELNPAVTAMGGCAGMAAGSIFSIAAFLYWRRPSRLAA